MAQDQARIWYQSFVHPVEQAPYMERLQALLDRVASPGVRFEVHGLDPPANSFHPLTEFRCAAQIIRHALEAEKAGYDAFVIGHFQEPGLLEIRSSVDIPVISLGEANLLDAELVTEPIDRFAPEGIVTADGKLRSHDVIVISTGFKVTEMAARLNISGREGKNLKQDWANDNRERIDRSLQY